MQEWEDDTQVGCLEYLWRYNNWTSWALGLMEITLLEVGYDPAELSKIKDQEVRMLIAANPKERDWPRTSAIPAEPVPS